MREARWHDGERIPRFEALRDERSLNPRPEAVRDPAFSGSEFLDASDLVQVKYEMVRRVRVDGEAVSRTAADSGSPVLRSMRPPRPSTPAVWPPWCRPVPARGGPTNSTMRSWPSLGAQLEADAVLALRRSGRPDRGAFRDSGPSPLGRAGLGARQPRPKSGGER